jgi:hypothetical protein
MFFIIISSLNLVIITYVDMKSGNMTANILDIVDNITTAVFIGEALV